MTKKWDVLLWFALLSSALWGVVWWPRDLIPANVVLIPAALVEAKATGASGSDLPGNAVLDKVITEPTLNTAKPVCAS